MRPVYDMSGGVRGKYASRPMFDKQTDNEVFSQADFDQSLRDTLNKIRANIESADGCNAGLYKPPNMRQRRAAHLLPAVSGGKKAKQVFLMVEPRKQTMILKCPRRFCKSHHDPERRIEVGASFSNWAWLKARLKEWSSRVEGPRKPTTVIDWGAGHALPGGLPETNKLKF